jgi:DNA-binding IclR family transcriptional regulator
MADLPARRIDGAALRATLRGPEAEPRDGLASATRTLRALELIASAPGPLPAKALAQQLNASLGSSYRVLHTLEDEGYAVRLAHGCYGLGPKLSSLFRMFQERFDVAGVARPVMAELADELGEDVFLAVLRSGEVAVAEIARGPSELHLPEPGVGFTSMAHTAAIGKVLLAGLADDDIDDYLRARPLEACTPHTLVERRRITADLRGVRERGLALDLEELAEGCCCVAAPVRDPWGATIASIGVSVPTERFRAERDAVARGCVVAAARLSRAVASDAWAGDQALRGAGGVGPDGRNSSPT